MGEEQASIVGASSLNVLCVFPETGELEMLIAGAILAPWVYAIVCEVAWDMATVDRHPLSMGAIATRQEKLEREVDER